MSRRGRALDTLDQVHHRHHRTSKDATTHKHATSRRQECLHQAQDASVSDPRPDQAHQGRMVDLVEARFDVSLNDQSYCGDRTRDSALRRQHHEPDASAEPVGTREEICLENRLQHQLQGAWTTRSATVGIPSRRNVPPAFGIIRSRTGSRTESCGPSNSHAQLVEELLHPLPGSRPRERSARPRPPCARPCCPAPDPSPPAGRPDRSPNCEVGPGRGAGLSTGPFLRPPPEPAVPVSEHPALHRPRCAGLRYAALGQGPGMAAPR